MPGIDDQKTLDKLAAAADIIQSGICDCYCQGEAYECDACRMRRALALIEEVLEPEHEARGVTPDRQMRLFPAENEGMHPDRLQADHHPNAELVYSERWKLENKRHAWLNHGFTTIEWILCPTADRPNWVRQRSNGWEPSAKGRSTEHGQQER